MVLQQMMRKRGFQFVSSPPHTSKLVQKPSSFNRGSGLSSKSLSPLTVCHPFQQQTRKLSLWGWFSSSSTKTNLNNNDTTVINPIEPPSELIVSDTTKLINMKETIIDIDKIQTNKDELTSSSVDLTYLPKLSDSMLDESTSNVVLTSIQNIGDFKLLDLCAITPVGLVERLIEAIYVTTGLPWWATIVLLSCTLRVLLFYPTINGQRASLKMAQIQHIINPVREQMKKAQSVGDHNTARTKMGEYNALLNKHNVSVLAGLSSLVQIPVFASGYLATKKLSELPLPGMENGGALWFTDLTQADPYVILPVTTAGLTYYMIRLGFSTSKESGKTISQTIQMGAMVAVPLMIFFTSGYPSAVFIFWITSSFLTMIQTKLLKNKTIRKKLDLPMPLSEDEIKVRSSSSSKFVEPLTLDDASRIIKSLQRKNNILLEKST